MPLKPSAKGRDDATAPPVRKRATPNKLSTVDGGLAAHQSHPRLAGRPPNNTVATPNDLFDALDAFFHFTYDPCPAGGEFDDAVPNGLTARWGPSVFLNPPYSDIEPWMTKAFIEYMHFGTSIVCLMPAHPETQYWVHYVWPVAREIWFCTTGVIFPGYKVKLPMAMCIVVFGFSDLPAYPFQCNDTLSLGRYRFRIVRLRGLAGNPRRRRHDSSSSSSISPRRRCRPRLKE
jgi:DNA N-6-adenine-methyltransferase (Dam)